jgi:hypothetical protein
MQSTIAWNSGNDDGVGSRFVPNSYPVVIDSIGGFVGGVGDVVLELYADDGVNNLPGTLLHTETFLSGSVTMNAWITSTLTVPDTIFSGGFYVVWIQPNTATTNLGTILTPPFSRRNVELVSGWEVYRDNETQEFMLEAWGNGLCSSLTSTSTFTSVSCPGGTDSIDIQKRYIHIEYDKYQVPIYREMKAVTFDGQEVYSIWGKKLKEDQIISQLYVKDAEGKSHYIEIYPPNIQLATHTVPLTRKKYRPRRMSSRKRNRKTLKNIKQEYKLVEKTRGHKIFISDRGGNFLIKEVFYE